MALPWFKVESGLVHHPKLAQLERLLPVDGLGVLMRLWAWTATYFPSGVVPASAVEQLGNEIVTVTRSLANVSVTEVVTALVSAGFLDKHRNAFEVHGWAELQGAHTVAAEKNRERQRRFREAHKVTHGVTLGNGLALPLRNALEEKRIDKKVLPRAHDARESIPAIAGKPEKQNSNSLTARKPDARPAPQSFVERDKAAEVAAKNAADDAAAREIQRTRKQLEERDKLQASANHEAGAQAAAEALKLVQALAVEQAKTAAAERAAALATKDAEQAALEATRAELEHGEPWGETP